MFAQKYMAALQEDAEESEEGIHIDHTGDKRPGTQCRNTLRALISVSLLTNLLLSTVLGYDLLASRTRTTSSYENGFATDMREQ